MTIMNDVPGHDERKRRNQRNLAIAGAVVAFVVLIYLVTLMRISATIGS